MKKLTKFFNHSSRLPLDDYTKSCEINSHPAIDYEQVMCGPTLSRPKVRAFFEHKGLRKFDGKDFYQAYIESQD